VHIVQGHDPAGYLPGRLLPTKEMQSMYYGVRSFWIETGLRFGTTAQVPTNATPKDHLEWWQAQIEELYGNNQVQTSHPTIRLLQALIRQHSLRKCHFEDILKGRMRNLEWSQYPTIKSLKEHAIWSCGSLSQLVLESQGMYRKNSPITHEASKLMGACHGLTNALRTSIPVISTTGKLVIPQDLCTKYNIESPAYLLSALGQGDKQCIRAMQLAVADIAAEARSELEKARALRNDILKSPHPNVFLSVLLPGLAS
jgi:phytoene/squalene synthetase